MAPPMSARVIQTFLGGIAPFSALSQAELEQLASAAQSIWHRKGARIFEEGAAADCCFVLTAGRLRVVLNSEDGEESVVNEIVPGDLVGEVALLDGYPRSAALVASDKSHLIAIPARAFDVLRRNFAFERELVAQVIARLRDSTEQVRWISSGDAVARVAWSLVRVARREGRREAQWVVIPRKTHEELAAMAGCARETVTRALRELEVNACVQVQKSTMRLDIPRIERYIGAHLGLGPRERLTTT